ncbi:MAG: hypothetical protein R6V06_02205 [Kiritimatiellia bacterium]
MKLPAEIIKVGQEPAVLAALDADSYKISSDPESLIPSFEINPDLRKNIFYAKSLGEIVISYESIEKELAAERKGLQHVNNTSNRISRLLFVTNDGSPRFYRELTYLQHKEGGRILICRLNITSFEMGKILVMPGTPVKAVLINRKRSVVNVLKTLIDL